MTGWTSVELNKIGNEEELDLCSRRSDGSLRDPVTMWVVRIGDELYVRAYKGRTSPWFKGVLTRHEGQIRCGGIEKEVTFVEEADPQVIEQVSKAFLTKYHHYKAEWVNPMITPEACEATLKLAPR